MKAAEFRYERPETLEAALALLGPDVAPLAGGQSLMPMMNFRIAAPEVLVDLNRVGGLDGIAVKDGWLEIGAMVRYSALAASDLVARAAPLIAMALPHVAHPAIRNRGTIGGSVALADPAAELPAVLLALGGEVVLASAGGTRTIGADDFFRGLYATAREEDELVTAIRVPVAAEGQRFALHEIARRHGDYAMAGCAIARATGPGMIAGADPVRAAFFAVADTPLRVPAVEAALASGDIGAAVAATQDIDADGDLNAGAPAKRHLAGVALRRAWAEVSP